MPSAPTPNPIQDHIELIARHEAEFLAQRTPSERFGDAVAGFAGNLKFVAIHLIFFAVWIALNTLAPPRDLSSRPERSAVERTASISSSPHFHRFDPKPFSLLSTIVTLEALLLAAFILMRQSRISRRADERDHLMLQVLLLTEKELTAVLTLEREIAKHVGLPGEANTPELRELSQQTSIEEVAQNIRENLPGTE